MNTSTLDKLRKMKFFGMFHAFKSSMETGKTNDYTADERSYQLTSGLR